MAKVQIENVDLVDSPLVVGLETDEVQPLNPQTILELEDRARRLGRTGITLEAVLQEGDVSELYRAYGYEAFDIHFGRRYPSGAIIDTIFFRKDLKKAKKT